MLDFLENTGLNEAYLDRSKKSVRQLHSIISQGLVAESQQTLLFLTKFYYFACTKVYKRYDFGEDEKLWLRMEEGGCSGGRMRSS